MLYERAADRVAKMFDERFVRMWRLYLLGSQAAFNVGELQLFQVVFAPGAEQPDPVDAGRHLSTMTGDDHAESCDVLIVGGGPAGSSCARQLRRAGLDVLILDKSEFPRDKVCAGWITPQVVEELEIDTRDYEQGRVLQPITSFVTGMGERAAKPVHYDKIVSYGIRRCEFDDYLLQRSGARLRLGEAWESMERVDGRWLVNGAITRRSSSAPAVTSVPSCVFSARISARASARSPRRRSSSR